MVENHTPRSMLGEQNQAERGYSLTNYMHVQRDLFKVQYYVKQSIKNITLK